jgi:hypothetical protein
MGRATRQKSQPRNGAVEIFAVVVAENRPITVSVASRPVRGLHKSPKIRAKTDSPKRQKLL